MKGPPTKEEIEQTRAMSFAICMAWDAFRICIGCKPYKNEYSEVIRWMDHVHNRR